MSRNSLRGKRWEETCDLVKERDGYRCVLCGSEDDLTVDHDKPLDLFSNDDWDSDLAYDTNHLFTMCRSCNGRKGNRTSMRLPWFNRRWLDGL